VDNSIAERRLASQGVDGIPWKETVVRISLSTYVYTTVTITQRETVLLH